MLDVTQTPLRGAPLRHSLKDWIADAASLLGLSPFARMSDAKLADHHWAAESALLRAVRCGQVQPVADLAGLVQSMEREMRRRGLM